MLVFIFALIGLWVGGFRGLLLGALLGFLVGRVLRTIVHKGLDLAQAQFVESTFAVAGAICKADGIVTKDEIGVAEQLFIRLRLSDQQRERAKQAFGRGKSDDFDLDAELARFARVSRQNTVLLQLFLQVQVVAALADGEVHPKEHEMLLRVARGLGLAEREVAQLEALLRAVADGAAPSPQGPPPQQRLDDAYVALGVTSTASDDEIKRAYRTLMKEHHPDRLAAKGYSESMRSLAEERARHINAAYELLKKVRNFT